MPKICNKDGCDNHVFGGGYCKWHQGYREDKKEKPVKPRKPIRQISKKRSTDLSRYRKERDEYMNSHPKCEVSGCNRSSNDLHHKKGRIGSLLYNRKFFMAVCRLHHNEIEEKPEWAYENGYALKRIT